MALYYGKKEVAVKQLDLKEGVRFLYGSHNEQVNKLSQCGVPFNSEHFMKPAVEFPLYKGRHKRSFAKRQIHVR